MSSYRVCARRLTLHLIFGLGLKCAYAQTFQAPKEPAPRYAIAFRLRLSLAENGIEGYLEVKQDARLNPKLKILWGTGDVNVDDDPELAMFKGDLPRNALIEVVDRRGKVLQSKLLERPLTRLRTAKLYEDSQVTYLLTVDYSAGFGSYSGPITSLWEVKGGHLGRVESTDARTGETGEISLMSSLKTVWKFVDAPDGKGKQILLAQCRPDWASVKDDPDFTITYARFYFDGNKWIVVERKVKRYSDFEDGFPRRKEFP